MQALRQQEDLAAIQAGIEDLEAGRFVTLEAADADIRGKLGFVPRTT
jgi:predicted transcriptional regulator